MSYHLIKHSCSFNYIHHFLIHLLHFFSIHGIISNPLSSIFIWVSIRGIFQKLTNYPFYLIYPYVLSLCASVTFNISSSSILSYIWWFVNLLSISLYVFLLLHLFNYFNPNIPLIFSTETHCFGLKLFYIFLFLELLVPKSLVLLELLVQKRRFLHLFHALYPSCVYTWPISMFFMSVACYRL